MMDNYPTFSYQQASAHGASPVGQIVLLFDTILRDFGRALAALEAGDVPTRVSELNHAVLVIGHLQSILNFERGEEAAKQFDRFYTITRAMILQANIRATPESIEELIDLYGGVRQAWGQAEKKLRVEAQSAPETNPPGEASRTSAARTAKDDIETPQLQWSA